MTARSSHAVEPGHDAAANAELERALRRGQWAIFWERLWPPLASVATVIGLFLALSWLGLWLWLPPMGRAIGLALFGTLIGAAAFPLVWMRWPSRGDALRRLDRVSGQLHRPATALADRIATGANDVFSLALWHAHIEQALRAAQCLRAGMPRPHLAAHDPVALRALVLLVVLVTFVAASGERVRRIAAAFDWSGATLPASFRLDAWVSPPLYTGKPPVMLPGVRPGEQGSPQYAALPVPAGSTLVVRVSGQARFDVVTTGGLTEIFATERAPVPAGAVERRFTISEGGTATVRGLTKDIIWTFTAIPDRAPTIALAKDPEPQARGALQLSYELEDDYGIVEARADFALKGQPVAGRPLFGAPEMPLRLPQARTKAGVGQTVKDLSEHPWAGADVTMTLVARDEAGNEGRSSPYELRLPERMFVKPLARALIEQRRDLALDADMRDRVLIALDALAVAPEKFALDAATYLGLRSLYWSLALAKTDDQLRDVVHRLWEMATQIEDGSVSDSEARLRQAQEALRQALERGASEEEVKKLMEELRAALDKFLQALAEELRKNPQMARPLDRNAMRELRAQDLRSMLDRLEQLARSGARDAARQLLEQLQQMLENLQLARPGPMGEDSADDMMSALDELGDMIREQQHLRDRTYRKGQERRRQQPSQPGEQGDQNAFEELRQNQRALRDRLKRLMEELKQRGLGEADPRGKSGQGSNQLGEAGEAMNEAEGQLGEGNADGAVDSQGRALEALRKGAQGLAQQLQQQMGQGPGPGQPGRLAPGRARQETDPLGRPLRGRDYGDDFTVKVPGEMDVQRARRILDELRRRLGETFRPQLELEYIERLLKDY